MKQKKNKSKQKANKEIKRILRKVANDKKALKEMALCTKGFVKLNGQEAKAWLNYMKRVEDNARYFIMREVFIEIYDRVGGIIKQDASLKFIQELEKKLRKKDGYWKVKKKPKTKLNKNN